MMVSNATYGAMGIAIAFGYLMVPINWVVDAVNHEHMRPMITVQDFTMDRAGNVTLERTVINEGVADYFIAIERQHETRSEILCETNGVRGYSKTEPTEKKWNMNEHIEDTCPETFKPGDTLQLIIVPKSRDLQHVRLKATVE